MCNVAGSLEDGMVFLQDLIFTSISEQITELYDTAGNLSDRSLDIFLPQQYRVCEFKLSEWDHYY